MASIANPIEPANETKFSEKQTVEFRCPDGSADLYSLIAGLGVAARYGLEMPNALEFAEKTYVDVDIFSDAFKDRLNSLEQLPTNCYESAQNLKRQADIYTQYGVFSQKMIDGMIEQLKAFKDQKLFKEVSGDPDKMMELVNKYFYCG